jgi:hypothetical protein
MRRWYWMDMQVGRDLGDGVTGQEREDVVCGPRSTARCAWRRFGSDTLSRRHAVTPSPRPLVTLFPHRLRQLVHAP